MRNILKNMLSLNSKLEESHSGQVHRFRKRAFGKDAEALEAKFFNVFSEHYNECSEMPL